MILFHTLLLVNRIKSIQNSGASSILNGQHFQRFIRQINSPEDAEFWAKVRVATSFEHQIDTHPPAEVQEYIQIRDMMPAD